MKRDRACGLLVGVISALLACGPQFGVAAEALHFGCDGHGGAENRFQYKHGLSFELVTAEALRAEAPLPKATARFGPFDPSRYGFRTVQFFVDTQPLDRRGFEPVPDPPARVRVIARMIGASSDTWWRLKSAGQGDLHSSMYPPHWDKPQQPAEPGMPLFLFSWGQASHGNGAECSWTEHLMFDFRDVKPSISVVFSCGDCEYFGACNAPDMGFEPRTAIDCAWNPTRADFLCTETTKVPLGWAERSYERYFLLLSKASISFQEMNQRGPASIEEMVTRLRRGKVNVGSALTVPGFGPVTAIATLPSRRGGDLRYVFAAPAARCDSEFRFYLAAASRSRQTTIQSIPSTRLSDDLDLETVGETDCGGTEDRGTRTGPAPTFTVSEIGRGSGELTFLRILAQEDRGRWVYLLGVDERKQPPQVEALLLATDTADYTRCNSFDYSPQLVPILIDTHPFRALVEAEPAHSGYWTVMPEVESREPNSGEKSTAIPSDAPSLLSRLLWTETDGFVLLSPQHQQPTEASPRLIVIDKDGQISLQTPKERFH